MNVADSERMGALLAEGGLSETENLDEAEVIIINGCTVREKAVHKALSTLGQLRNLKKKRPSGKAPVIGIGGCVAQIEKDKLFKQAPYLDFVFGTDSIDHLPEILHRVGEGERKVIYTDFDRSNNYSVETKVYKSKAQAYVNIMKGCDKYCTYCIVPFTRGKEKSRLIDEVLEDISKMVAKGVREITLLGQNVNSFGKGNPNTGNRTPLDLTNVIGKVGPREGDENFPQLLHAIENDPRLVDLKRLRFTSSHPLDFSDELIECYKPSSQGGVGKLAGQLHLPVQSGSNRILEKMGRHHKIENYIQQMDRLREINPDVAITTDLIVGFPTETEEDFQATIALLDKMQYDTLYAFAYSPRPGTRAAKLPDDVPDSVKRDRLNKLLQHQLEISEKRFGSKLGKVMEILVEGEARNQLLSRDEKGVFDTSKKVWTGRTTCNKIVNFIFNSPRNITGQLINVKITGTSALALQGEAIV